MIFLLAETPLLIKIGATVGGVIAFMAIVICALIGVLGKDAE